ncbi:hypothetical protein ATZ33_11825 [Enterococcus silesiacus]|uniref:Uncharacterized protein n=1 Tax=Enterococcus silesiacus TaxID=332949 RepID=A0A0S3KCK7_9ENTE|nr:TIGR04197 family type VII secretion effector [Enterococcus silesiacus]ALS02048.1 hypothetical protein ATZ33_11825 [Enterococcus silesiacus]OJG88950.1 hypothetical protein RV15_GL001686 [Enterococcus silesiacus]
MENEIKINIPEAKKYAHKLNENHQLLSFDVPLSLTSAYSDLGSTSQMKQVVSQLEGVISDMKDALSKECVSFTSTTEEFETLDQVLGRLLGIDKFIASTVNDPLAKTESSLLDGLNLKDPMQVKSAGRN